MNKNSIIIFIAIFLLVTGGLAAQNAQELHVGSALSEYLHSGRELWYSVRATQNGIMSIETSSDFDTVLEAYDASRSNKIAEDDDSGVEYNACLTLMTVSGTTYMIKLRGYYGENGPFTIKAAAVQPTELRLGTPQSANLSDGEKHWYSLRGTENNTVAIETSGRLDTYMTLYNSSFEQIGSDDDGGEDYNARIDTHVTAGSTYYIMVRGISGDTSGPYSILANVKVVVPPTALRFGTRVNARLSSRDEHWYSIRITEDGIITVETSGSTDTYMEAYDSSDKLIAENDDGGNGNNARIEMNVSANQTYTFKVKGYGGESGSYSIIATYMAYPPDERNTERSRAVTLQLGVVLQVRLITTNESRWFSYNMPRPGRFVVQTKGNMDTELNLYDSRGTRITGDDDSGDGSNALISENIEAGTYYIEVKSRIGRTGRCTLHSEIW
jgi:hypothetical protein